MPDVKLLPKRLAFSAHHNGQLRTDLRKAFLKSQMITNEDCEIGMVKHDGIWWLLILEGKREAEILERYEKLWAILSFQENKDGQRIAIARAHSITKGH